MSTSLGFSGILRTTSEPGRGASPPGENTRIGNWGVPLCKRGVQSFIGVLNFHRDHISKFALVAKPLYYIMGPSATFSWGTEQEKAFDALRQKLMEAPVLAYLNSEDLFILDTDASNHASAAELLQVQNRVERLIGFGSFVIDPAQRNYGIIMSEFIGRFGCPLELHNDQGCNFESRMFKEVCDLLKIVKTRTTPYRPSANGQVERMNRTILQILRCFIQGQQEDWDQHLATVGMAIRSTVNRQT